MNGAKRNVTLLVALVLGVGLACGWLATGLTVSGWVRLPASPWLTGAILCGVLSLGALIFGLLLRRPGLALILLVVGVWTNLSEILVRFHGWPSLLQLLAIPVLATALWNAKGSASQIVRSPVFLTVTGWLLWNGVSIFWALRADTASDRVLDLLKAWLVFVLVALLGTTLLRLRRATWGLVWSAALLAAMGAWQVATGEFSQQFGGLARVKDAQIFGNVFEPRIAGPLGDPNFFAQILLMAVPLALALGWTRRPDRRALNAARMLSLSLAAVLLTGLLLTYSRGAAVALLLVLLGAPLLRGVRSRHLMLGGILIVIIVLIAPFGFLRRLETLKQMLPGVHTSEAIHPDSSFAKRRLVTATAWEVFSEHPILGVGSGNYGEAFFDSSRRVGTDAILYGDPGVQNYPHNLYLESAAETGGVGFTLFGLMIVSAATTLWTVRTQTRTREGSELRALADGLTLAIAGFLFTALFLHWEFPRYFSLILGLVVGLGVASNSRTVGAVSGVESNLGGGRIRGSGALDGRSDAPVAAPIAVVVSRFPKLTETFILREIIELERQGQPVVLVPLMRHREPVVHEQARAWIGRARFTPWLSWEIARANFGWLQRRPGRYALTLLRLLAGAICSPATLAKSLALFPKAAYLAEKLPAEGVGHLHAHFATHPTTLALIVHRLSGVPFSFSAHAHDIFVRRELLAWKIREAEFVRVISRFNHRYLRERYGVDRDRLRMIHMGIDVDRYSGERNRSENRGPSGAPLILCVAALQEYKGINTLIEACTALRRQGQDFRCRIVGEGPERPRLQRLIDERGVKAEVQLSGAKTESEVRQAMAEATVVVQPSVVARNGQMEGIPVALIEAGASGRAVVASCLSGIPELVDDEVNGLLVQPGEPAALANALDRLLGDPGLRSRLGSAGKQIVRDRFKLSNTVSELRRILEDSTRAIPEDWNGLARLALQPGESGGVVRAQRSPDAIVLEVLVSSVGSTSRRFVKKARTREDESRSASERSAREAAALTALGESTTGLAATLPRLLKLLADDGILVTSACGGRGLDELLREARSRPGSEALSVLTPAVIAAGEWLRRFQRCSLPPLPGDRALVESTPSRVAGAVPSHGDFWPGNVRFEHRRVWVVDFEGIDRREPSLDAAWFLAHLQRYLRRPWQVSLWIHLREAFIEAWSGEKQIDRCELQQAYQACRRRMRRKVRGREENPLDLWRKGADATESPILEAS